MSLYRRAAAGVVGSVVSRAAAPGAWFLCWIAGMCDSTAKDERPITRGALTLCWTWHVTRASAARAALHRAGKPLHNFSVPLAVCALVRTSHGREYIN